MQETLERSLNELFGGSSQPRNQPAPNAAAAEAPTSETYAPP